MRFQPPNFSASGPLGRHWYAGRVLKYSCCRWRTRSLTHGCRLAATGRDAGGSEFHTPVKSGFPFGARGAAAVRFGAPSALRGISGVFRSTHWARAGVVATRRASAARNSLIQPSDVVGRMVARHRQKGPACAGPELLRNVGQPRSLHASIFVGAGYVNDDHVRGYAFVVHDELITQSQTFEHRVRERHQRPRRAIIEASGTESALDVIAEDLGDQGIS